jgi:hypothetical protein
MDITTSVLRFRGRSARLSSFTDSCKASMSSKTVKICIAYGKDWVAGGGVMVGKLIITPYWLVENKGRVMIQYPNGVLAPAQVVSGQPNSTGFACLRHEYFPPYKVPNESHDSSEWPVDVLCFKSFDKRVVEKALLGNRDTTLSLDTVPPLLRSGIGSPVFDHKGYFWGFLLKTEGNLGFVLHARSMLDYLCDLGSEGVVSITDFMSTPSS